MYNVPTGCLPASCSLLSLFSNIDIKPSLGINSVLPTIFREVWRSHICLNGCMKVFEVKTFCSFQAREWFHHNTARLFRVRLSILPVAHPEYSAWILIVQNHYFQLVSPMTQRTEISTGTQSVKADLRGCLSKCTTYMP